MRGAYHQGPMSWWHLQPWNLAGVGLVERGGRGPISIHTCEKKKWGSTSFEGVRCGACTGSKHPRTQSLLSSSSSSLHQPRALQAPNSWHNRPCKEPTPTGPSCHSPLRRPLGDRSGSSPPSGTLARAGDSADGKEQEKEAELSKRGLHAGHAPARPAGTQRLRWEVQAAPGGSPLLPGYPRGVGKYLSGTLGFLERPGTKAELSKQGPAGPIQCRRRFQVTEPGNTPCASGAEEVEIRK